ncbi:hypothetical protein N9L68_07050 [bacterium]|nr:hypothetical protein [bacterium]
MGEGAGQGPHASEHHMTAMVDEATGNKYIRAVSHKGLRSEEDNIWLVKDMHEELEACGYPGVARIP